MEKIASWSKNPDPVLTSLHIFQNNFMENYFFVSKVRILSSFFPSSSPKTYTQYMQRVTNKTEETMDWLYIGTAVAYKLHFYCFRIYDMAGRNVQIKL